MGRVNNLDILEGMSIRNLSVIENEKGSVLHMIRSDSEYFETFGEIYFSEVMPNAIKGWKKHNIMTLNLVVITGEIKFVITDKKNYFEVILSKDNYQRLSIAPGLWLAFKGLSKTNVLLNLANIEHDPHEIEKISLSDLDYDWNKN